MEACGPYGSQSCLIGYPPKSVFNYNRTKILLFYADTIVKK